MNRTIGWALLVLVLIAVVLQIVLLFRTRAPGEIDQRTGHLEQQSGTRPLDSATISTLQPEIEKRFERLDDRLAEIENQIGAIREIDEGISRRQRQSETRAPDSGRASTLESEIEKRLDSLDYRLAKIENQIGAIREIDQKITRLGSNLGTRSLDSWSGSTLQSDIQKRFDSLDKRLNQIENRLK